MNPQIRNAGSAAAATFALAAISASSSAQPVDDLLSKITSKDDAVRGPAWQAAGPIGAPAVKPLAAAMSDSDMEIARAAKRALWKIVRYAGRPGAETERASVAGGLVMLLNGQPTPVRRETLWMLSEIGGGDTGKGDCRAACRAGIAGRRPVPRSNGSRGTNRWRRSKPEWLPWGRNSSRPWPNRFAFEASSSTVTPARSWFPHGRSEQGRLRPLSSCLRKVLDHDIAERNFRFVPLWICSPIKPVWAMAASVSV